MISTSDFKKHLRILIDGDPYVILDVHVQSPSARGASSLSKIRVRNLRTGQVLDKTFRGVVEFLEREDADVLLLQELDAGASRTDGEDQAGMLRHPAVAFQRLRPRDRRQAPISVPPEQAEEKPPDEHDADDDREQHRTRQQREPVHRVDGSDSKREAEQRKRDPGSDDGIGERFLEALRR